MPEGVGGVAEPRVPPTPARVPVPAQSPGVAPASPASQPDAEPPVAAPTPRTSPPRAGARRLALLAGAALGLAAGAYAAYHAVVAPRVVIPTPLPITLKPFDFETVMVNERGDVIQRRTLTARSYTEDLGGGVTLEMVAVPGGRFTMGSPPGEAERRHDEGPQRSVVVASFFMGKFEVTQAQWRTVASWPRVELDLPSAPSFFHGDQRPVERVSWYEAVEFCARLTRQTGRAYRLPSESEWAHAARAGTLTPFAFGPTITQALVNYDGAFPYGSAPQEEYRGHTTDVGSVGFANGFGLFDVHGNVWEWTQDDWHATFAGGPEDGRAWEWGGDAKRRVMRGGAWDGRARRCRSAVRHWALPAGRGSDSGFRVACDVPSAH